MEPNPKVDAYVAALDPPARSVAEQVRELIFAEASRATEEFKWSRPCYQTDGPICSFLACKGHISLAFEKGTSLDDPSGLLEGAGKSMRHVKIRHDEKVPPGVRGLVRQAAAQDA